MEILSLYLLVMNALGLLLMIRDKQQAIKRGRRIPEFNLIMVAALGGSLGSLLGMYIVRHKTRHLRFTVGIPVMLFIHVILILLLLAI